MTTTPLEFKLDRTHRFAEGDLVRHIDTADSTDPRDLLVIDELTIRVVEGVAYPTYTITDRSGTERVEDVLCTLDLIPA